MIFGDSLKRIANEPHATFGEISDAPKIVEDLPAAGVGHQGVDGEIATRGVLPPVVGIFDDGPPAVGRDVATEAGDFKRLPGADRRDGAVVYPGGHCLELRCFESIDCLVGAKPGREIDIVDRKPEQIVAHRAADVASQPFTGAECIENCREPRPTPPSFRVQLCH